MTSERAGKGNGAREVAIVTGAGKGIGSAIARRLGADGYAVVCAEIADEHGRHTAEAIEVAGGQALFVHADVTRPEDVQAMIDAAIERFGRLDVVVNNVGLGVPGRLHEISLEDWRLVLDTSLSSVFYATKFAMPHLLERRNGRIVNIASVQGLFARRGAAAYNAAKGGVVNLTRNIALDYAADGLRCNCICPGAILVRPRDEYAERLAQRGLRYPEARTVEEVEAMHPLGRMGTPEEIAGATAFLVSPDAGFVTGETLVADGGLTIQVLA